MIPDLTALVSITEIAGGVGLVLGAAGGFLTSRASARKTNAEADRQLAEIHHEVKPNSGTSMKDSTTRIEAGQQLIQKQISELRADITEANRISRTGIEGVHRRIDALHPDSH